MRDGLHALELQQLELLHVLLQECSVTRAAEKSGQTQPAVSRTLRRLREVLGDPLLVRSGTRLLPTERAQGLREPLSEILAQLARMEAGAGFDPATAQREFHIACADCLPPELLPRIIERVMAAGPGLRVRMRLIDPAFNVEKALEDGAIDLVINNSPKPREDLRLGVLFTDEVVCLMRADHPMAGERRLPLARYLGLRHLAPHPSSMRELGPVDGELAKTGYRRHIAATVPEFNMVPYVLARTDLVFTTGRHFAEHYAGRMALAVVRAPSEFPPMRFYQLWHELNHGSSSNRWLRQQVRAAALP
ncbi:LysR family transcriptional regulator [uncultured Pseudacidovorax sp.]|uniref:LysR family transcriptional regulator n=1 Tax=uncultured Pseudacidovorax sp. TaxID=679313 RepID=UPI0025D9EBEA|nr:LysR family transcriptional regulator [uncultured Pseudacidovorax sp.]